MIIDNTWTLFLDRDGVINKEIPGSYVYELEKFELYEGALEAICFFAKHFNKIIIVTNQRGIGKELYTIDDVNKLHNYLQTEVQKTGGRIDEFYIAPDFDLESPMRKPNTGMGLQAKKDFPEIDFSKSIMIGNNLSDMKFGRTLGMKTIFVETTVEISIPNDKIDFSCPSLQAASILLEDYL
jgi:histidinol-phosphate phosphatase family protein